MPKLKLNARDVSLFCFLHQNKVASTKHILMSVFKTTSGTARKRLFKLRSSGLINAVCRDEDGDKSIVYSLTRKGFNVVCNLYPEDCIIKRYKSNSVNHDLRLLEIQKVLTNKIIVSAYWTENVLHSSLDLQRSLKLLPYKNLQVDAVLRLGKAVEDYFYCGVEYEASLKSQAEYAKKISAIYSTSKIEAILYITKDPEIERRIKKSELEFNPKGDKKIYFTQLDKVTNESRVVTFINQDSNFLEVY